MRFETAEDAFEGLTQASMHEAAALVLLAHADEFDRESSWAFARPMAAAIIARYRDLLDGASAGVALVGAMRRLKSYYEDQVISQRTWYPDIDTSRVKGAEYVFVGS